MKKFTTFKKLAATLTAMALIGTFTATTQAVIIPIDNVTGHNGGQGFGSPSGELITMIDLSGMDVSADPTDPAQWVANSNSWPNEWQSTALLSGASNSKIGWTAFTFDNTYELQSLYLWNVRETSTRRVDTYNIYYALEPTVPLPSTPGETVTIGDYDFSSGGWTLFNGSPLTLPFRGSNPQDADAVVNLTGVTATYIGIEILGNGGDANRVGLAEVAFLGTQVIPEPSTMFLLGVGGLMLLRYPRRAAKQ